MRTLSAIGILALVLAFAATAEAKSPPKGRYDCVIGADSQLFGSITIKSKGAYRYSRFGKSGTFKAGRTKKNFSGTPAYPIRFKGGGLSRYSGYWFTSKTGTHEIALAAPKSGFTNIYCDK